MQPKLPDHSRALGFLFLAIMVYCNSSEMTVESRNKNKIAQGKEGLRTTEMPMLEGQPRMQIGSPVSVVQRLSVDL